MTPTSGRDRRPRSGGSDTRWARPSLGRDDILQRPAASRSAAEARSCISSVIRGRSVIMDRPPVCEMVKRHEVWSPNPPAMGNRQSKSAGRTLTCAWRLVQRLRCRRERQLHPGLGRGRNPRCYLGLRRSRLRREVVQYHIRRPDSPPCLFEGFSNPVALGAHAFISNDGIHQPIQLCRTGRLPV